MLGHPGDLARGLEGRHHPPGARRLGPLRAGHLGALPRRHRPLRAARPGRGGARAARRADRAVVLRGRRQPRLPARRPVRAGDHPDPAAAADPPARPVRLPARRRGDPGVTSRSTSATARSPSAPRSTCRTPGAQGVLFAHGSRFGGHALYVKDSRLHYVNNFVGVTEQRVDATEDLPDRRRPDPVGELRQGRRGPARAPPTGRCRCTTATARSARARSAPSPASSPSPARGSPSAATAGSRSPTTTRAPRPGGSPAARCTGSPSTSPESRTATWSGKPPRCSSRE